MIQDPLSIVALIAGIAALAFWLDRRFRRFSRVGAVRAVGGTQQLGYLGLHLFQPLSVFARWSRR